MSLVSAVGQIWNDHKLVYICSTVIAKDPNHPGQQSPDESFNANIRSLEPYECHYRNDLESGGSKNENWCFTEDILLNFNNGSGPNDSHLSAMNDRTKIANAVKAPLIYIAVFFILQWLWDFIILVKLHGYVEYLSEKTAGENDLVGVKAGFNGAGDAGRKCIKISPNSNSLVYMIFNLSIPIRILINFILCLVCTLVAFSQMMIHDPKNPACCSYKTQCTTGILTNVENQLEQSWPDLYCQHENPSEVLNVGYTSSILWLLAMISGIVLHLTSLVYYIFVLLTNGFMCGQGLTSVEKFIFPGITKLEDDERLEIFQISK